MFNDFVMHSFLVPAAFMLADIITGVLQALKTKTLQSTKIRKGLWHKLGLLLIIAFTCALDWVQLYYNTPEPIPVCNTTIIVIIFMEVVSIFENVLKLLPKDKAEKLSKIVRIERFEK